MGAGQSTAAADDEFFQDGVRITQGLLDQLEGKPRRGGGGSTQQTLRPEDPDAAAVAQLAAQDRSLARALERSRRLGGLLLKAEGEELRAVQALAEELAGGELAAAPRPRPCGQHADDCVRCYADHAGDPLACAPAVEAYAACARAAWREAMQREP